MARKPLIAGNWKMFTTHLEAIALVQALHYMLGTNPRIYDEVEVVVCPPFTALRSVQTLIESDNIPIGLGAQNCHWETEGAFTGEIAPAMLARLKCRYVIVGHSERRQSFAESDEIVNRKAKAVFAAGMTPIVCVGERLEERDAGATEDVVSTQVSASLAGLTAERLGALVVAYEPIWAIGTGRNAQPSDANQVVKLIRETVGGLGGRPAADAVRVLYGGSVNAGNVAGFMSENEIDGALVGGASVKLSSDGKPEEFALIVRYKG